MGDMDDAARFRRLFEEAYPSLKRYGRHRGLSAGDAEDLVAATFEVAWRRFGEIPYAAPLPWLYAVAHNLWRNRLRAERRRSSLLGRLGPPASAPPPPEPSEPAAGVVRAALARLRPPDQEVLRLVAWEHLSAAEVGTVLGCSEAAARTRLRRARDRLAAELEIDRPAPAARPGGRRAVRAGEERHDG
jgi:RNA polymerase sigma factor (sigma-70 family)